MRRLLLSFLLISIPAIVLAKDKKAELPRSVVEAKTVYVTGWHGTEFDKVPMDERSAITRVQNAIDHWHSYRVVTSPEKADIILIVRMGGLAGTRGTLGGVDPATGRVGVPPVFAGSIGGGYGGSQAPEDDTLLVALNRGATHPQDEPPVWKRSARNGFAGRELPLVQAFKKAVTDSQ